MRLKTIKIFGILTVIVGIMLFGYFILFIGRPAVGCVVSGGKVMITRECRVSDNFYNSCQGVGACAPEYSVNKLSCQCLFGCFNGSKCENN